MLNFKGVKEAEYIFNGKDANYFGDNETGKTTQIDALLWTIFNKDSQNSSKFDVKTLVDGKAIPKLNHEVEIELLVDGKPLVLKKTYTEKWTKKKGSPTASFTGHTTDHQVNSVPVSKKEYDEKVSELIDVKAGDDVVELLTNPSFFNNKLPWKKRLEKLIEISGNVSDEEVIQSNSKLSKIEEILNGRTIEEHQKMITETKKKINKELDRIPIRIDEIHRGLPDLNGLDKNQLQSEIDKLSFQIEDKQGQINNIKSGSEINKVKTEISDLNLQISNVKNEHAQQGQTELYKHKTRLQEEWSNLNILESDLQRTERYIATSREDIRVRTETMNRKRDEWTELNKQELRYESDCNCPTCGQELPNEQIETARERALQLFNTDKSQRLESLKKQGLELKANIEGVQIESEKLAKNIEKTSNQIEDSKNEIVKIEKKIELAEKEVTPIEDNAEYMELANEKQALQETISKLEESVQESIKTVQTEIDGLKERQNALQVDLNKFTQMEQSQERIAELEEEETELVAKYEELEAELYLTEEFTRAKVEMLTDKINSKFKFTKFRLFKDKINGGIEETCEATYKGVPYESNLNSGARINVDLDVLNTMSEHYGVRFPVFIDNAESVTKLFDIDSQIIRLVVSENDKTLRFEINEDKKEKGVA